jgi:hypothetical protein
MICFATKLLENNYDCLNNDRDTEAEVENCYTFISSSTIETKSKKKLGRLRRRVG